MAGILTRPVQQQIIVVPCPFLTIFNRLKMYCLRSLVSITLANLLIVIFTGSTDAQNRYFHYRLENLKPNDAGFFSGEYKIEPTPDGGFIIANKEWVTDNIFAIKFDSCGEIAWSRRLGNMQAFSSCSGMVTDAAGQVAMIFQRYDLSGDDYVFAVKLDAAGKILWKKRIAFAGTFGKADFHLASDGRYCFGSNFDDGTTSDHYSILLDAETGAISAAYRLNDDGTGSGVPFYANLPNGNLLIRRLNGWISFNLNTEKVDWAVRFNDPAAGWDRTKPLVLGDKLVYASLANPLPTTGKMMLRFFDLQGGLLFNGDVFLANQTNVSSIGSIPRQLTELPGKRFALATAQKMPELQIALIVFDSLGRQISTKHFHPKTDVYRKAHDQVLLSDGSVAIVGESDGRIEVLKVSPEKTIDFCIGDSVSLPSSPLQDNIASLPPSAFQVEKVQFPITDFQLTEQDFDLAVEKICDSTRIFPDRDSLVSICRSDSVRVSAAGGLPAACVWDDGFEGCERVLHAGDGTKTAEVRVRCTHFLKRFLVEEKTDCPCRINYPTAFTPNGDGVNDSFRPVSDCRFLEYDFEIFNRWGQSVFVSTNFETGWDGNTGGQQAPSDLYVFTLKYRTAVTGSGEVFAKGDVALLR
jgi:gliding motility-associated-like protein